MKKLETKKLEMMQGGFIEFSPGQTLGFYCIGTWAAMNDPNSSNSLSYLLAESYAAYCLY